MHISHIFITFCGRASTAGRPWGSPLRGDCGLAVGGDLQRVGIGPRSIGYDYYDYIKMMVGGISSSNPKKIDIPRIPLSVPPRRRCLTFVSQRHSSLINGGKQRTQKFSKYREEPVWIICCFFLEPRSIIFTMARSAIAGCIHQQMYSLILSRDLMGICYAYRGAGKIFQSPYRQKLTRSLYLCKLTRSLL